MKETTSYIQLNRTEATLNLIKRRQSAFVLLTLIALRAKRTDSKSFDGLAPGEAFIGDHESYGVSRAVYRRDLYTLKTNHLVSTKTTNKGTIAKLEDSSIFNINVSDANQQTTTQRANKEPATDHQRTTNKNDKNEINILTNVNTKASFGHPMVNFVCDWFAKEYQFKPTDKFPRNHANNLVKGAQKLINTSGADLTTMSLEERTKGVLLAYFSWMRAQEWSKEIKTMRAVYKNFDVWQARELGKVRYGMEN